MARSGTVHYHVHAPHRQAYHIDAGGVVGQLVSPEHVIVDVPVRDAREPDVSVSFEADGIEFARRPTAVHSFDEGYAWQATYDAELTVLLTESLGAKAVVIFDHTVRVDDPNAERKPARNVHTDYSDAGAHQRLIDVLGADAAAEWSAGHYAFINVWRPIEAPINSAPLGFVRPSSVPDEDWILLDLIYPDRRGHIMGLVANPAHEWIYRSRMTPDEVVYFNIYDHRGRPAVAHSALDLVEDPSVHTIRRSIESRTLVRF
jgi:hypothetical protein